MATFNRKFGNNTPVSKAADKESSKTGVAPGEPVGDSRDTQRSETRSSNPAGTKVETRTNAPSGANQEVWQQAEAQVVSSFGGLDDKARQNAVQARYDSMVKSDEQVKDWAGNDSQILGDIGQK